MGSQLNDPEEGQNDDDPEEDVQQHGGHRFSGQQHDVGSQIDELEEGQQHGVEGAGQQFEVEVEEQDDDEMSSEADTVNKRLEKLNRHYAHVDATIAQLQFMIDSYKANQEQTRVRIAAEHAKLKAIYSAAVTRSPKKASALFQHQLMQMWNNGDSSDEESDHEDEEQ